MDKLTAATSALHPENSADEVDPTAAATTTSPFFRLPRELRDQIYDLVALSEHKITYDVMLRVGEPPRKKVPFRRDVPDTRSLLEKAYRAHFPRRVVSARSQFELEYSAAVGRRVKMLLVGSDLGGLQLPSPGPGLHPRVDKLVRKLGKVRLGYSSSRDGKIAQNVHYLKIAMPLVPSDLLGLGLQAARRRDYPMMVVVFGFPDTKELGTILSLDIPLQNSFSAGCMRFRMPRAYGYGNLMSKAISAAEEVSWEGCVREHMVWQTYFADCANDSDLED